jgi:hypothetical protein
MLENGWIMTDRANPGPRYRELVAQYERLHMQGEPNLGLKAEETYPGVSLMPHIGRIKALIERAGAQTLLDYGCGKGMQYEPQPITGADGLQHDSLLDYWDLDEVRCYDPCYGPYQVRPEGQFDGVICTDVLEHCAADDLEWIIGDLFGYARKFVFASIACYAAKSRLPNGENAHCTVQPPAWWEALFARCAAAFPGIRYQLVLIEVPGPDDPD